MVPSWAGEARQALAMATTPLSCEVGGGGAAALVGGVGMGEVGGEVKVDEEGTRRSKVVVRERCETRREAGWGQGRVPLLGGLMTGTRGRGQKRRGQDLAWLGVE
eukprot:2412152-Rhodomonas_salina.1